MTGNEAHGVPPTAATASMLTVPDAMQRVLAGIAPLPPERVSIADCAGRVLASDVVAPLTLPPWDNSAMDGYAVRSVDLAGVTSETPVSLRVLETVAAGGMATSAIGAGEAIRIMTGAPIPPGADGVIRVEDTDGGVEQVRIRDARDAGRNVRRRGEDFHEGDAVLVAGSSIAAAQVGILASMGRASVDVHRAPRVAILGSGDELVDLDGVADAIAGRKIISSNSYTLAAMVRECGGVPLNLGIAADSRDSLREHLLRAVGAADLLVTSAGISVGEFDYLRAVLGELGAELDFWRVRMRPGAPIGFGRLGGIPWLGLPGNPVSTMVTFQLFARPIMRRMLGHSRLHRRPVAVVLDEPVSIGARLTHFLRAIVHVAGDGRLHAKLTGPQGSGILTSMARANALLIVPESDPSHEAGDTLAAILLTSDADGTDSFALAP